MHMAANRARSQDGTAIAFDRSGDGPPLVLVVGAFCDRTSKKSLTAALSPRFTVYEYDRRGRGDSGGGRVHTVAQEVDDLAAVIDAAGGEAFVFGDSSGGALAIEAAAAGVPVRELAVYEVPYTDGPTLAVADELAGLVAAGRPGEAAERFLALMGTPPAAIAQMKAGPYWRRMEGFAPTLADDVRLCNDGHVPADRLAKISVPLLAVAGGASPWAAPVAAAIAAAAPHGRQRVLEGEGHAVADDALAGVLTEFFA